MQLLGTLNSQISANWPQIAIISKTEITSLTTLNIGYREGQKSSVPRTTDKTKSVQFFLDFAVSRQQSMERKQVGSW